MAADPTAGDVAHANGHHDPFDHLFHHVMDANAFDIPGIGVIELPKISFLPSIDALMDGRFEPLQVTKFMVLQVVAFVLAVLIFVPLARMMREGRPIRGRFWGFWEAICLYLRDEVVRPTIGDPHTHNADFSGTDHVDSGIEPRGQFDPGHAEPLRQHQFATEHGVHTELPAHDLGGHPADRYLPFVWSIFFYVLFCNLLGAVPGFGTPTGDLSVTSVLAIAVFAAVLFVGMKASGVGGFWANLVPGMEVSGFLKPLLIGLLWPIEFFGLLVKHFVLAVRLFANMMAGHTVLFAILAFIALAANYWLAPGHHPAVGNSMYGLIMVSSVIGQVLISLLELLVAFIQAYVFAFLATLFISAAVHPH